MRLKRASDSGRNMRPKIPVLTITKAHYAKMLENVKFTPVEWYSLDYTPQTGEVGRLFISDGSYSFVATVILDSRPY